MLDDSQYKKALSQVIRFISIRSRSLAELKKYIDQKPWTDDLKSLVLQKAHDLKLVDDNSFSEELIASKIRRLYGPQKIVRDLQQKGLSIEASKQIINQVESSRWQQAIRQYLQKKRLTAQSLQDRIQKNTIEKALYGRGFYPADIRIVIDDVLNGE